jgi:hypothetical protein
LQKQTTALLAEKRRLDEAVEQLSGAKNAGDLQIEQLKGQLEKL